MNALRSEHPVLEVQKGNNLSSTLGGFETALPNLFLAPLPVLSVQSYRRNSISGIELWRNRPFSVELPVFGFGGFPVRSSTACIQNPAKLRENGHIKVKSSRRNSISGIELWRNRPFSVELPRFAPKLISGDPFQG